MFEQYPTEREMLSQSAKIKHSGVRENESYGECVDAVTMAERAENLKNSTFNSFIRRVNLQLLVSEKNDSDSATGKKLGHLYRHET